ncbi:MAG: folylpolyglutamate synthase/dihydrofolate synthase family protein [bacterium]
MNYQETLACLESLEVYGIVFGLERIRQILDELENPQRRFRSLHIAGTNGKGSTAAYLASVLEQAGYRTGLYTSPHLNRFSERIQICGEEIQPGQVIRYTERILSVIRAAGPGFKPTYFEVTTAMAFAHFADMGVEFAVVEAGMGGRLDATNVLDPEVSAITNVSLEHTEYLGASVEEIAREKGGIIKEGVDVVTAEKDPGALAVLKEICDQRRSRLVRAGHDIKAESVSLDRSNGSRTFDFRGEEHSWKGLSIGLMGAYQVQNAVISLGILEGLIRKGVEIPDAAVRRGLSETRWPCRMEVVSRDPYVILDGAHNPHAAQALLRVIEEDLSFRELILVIGIFKDKDIPSVVTPLVKHADHLILTRPLHARSADPHALFREIQRPGLDIRVMDRIPDAIEHALSLYRPGDLILITGSLYTVGEAREYLVLS